MGTFAWIMAAAAVVAFVIAPWVLYVCGRRLPAEHEASSKTRLSATRDEVFALLTDVRAIPRWRKTVGKVDLVACEPRVRFREHGAQGALELEVAECVRPSKLVVVTAPARRMVFRGTWTYALEDDGDGTRVTLTERGTVHSPIARLFAAYVLGHATHVERTTAALSARFAKR